MDSFLLACGAGRPPELEIRGRARRRVRLGGAAAVVGRAAAADLRLDHTDVGERHAYLQLVAGRLACIDLGGGAGLPWDDGRPARAGWLDPGRAVWIGPFEIRRTDAPPVPEPAADTPPLATRWLGDGPDIMLEFPDEAGGPLRWRVGRVLTLLGRAPGCRVRLPDEAVSWIDSSLVRTPDATLWALDLLGRGALRVNGEPRRRARLDDGDELHLGPFRVLVRFVAPGQGQRPLRASNPEAASPSLGMARPAGLPAPAPRAGVPATFRPPASPELTLEPEIVDLIAAGRAGDSPALVLLVERFGQMQQQMLEQFHQAMMMMMDHFGSLHREQVREVRAEVDRLRDLSAELVALEGRLGRAAAPEHAPPAPTPARTNGQAHIPAPPPAPAAAPAARPAPRPAPAPTPEAAPPAGVGTDPDADPVLKITMRIAQIRSEQRTRWQRIMDLVRGR